MALRLIGTEKSSEPAAASAAQPSVAGLVTRAHTLLASDDADGYRRLFDRAAQLPDPQRVYVARTQLIEAGLITGSRADPPRAASVYAAVAGAGLDVLDEVPAEPVLLNYAAVACYELWALEAAQLLFRAAKRLDPALPNVDSNLAHVKRRRRGPQPRRPLHPLVTSLKRRARTVADRARTTSGETISLCMIVRDEEEMLPRCLAAAAPAVDEIVIVDTGSTDRTIEIANEFGARVIERPWDGSFANARNASFQAATGDWLLYLDADELLVADDAARLRALTGHTWREAYHLLETSFTGELGDGTAVTHNALRLLRNRPEYRFEGEIHEQIAPALPTWAPGRIGHCTVRIEHYGYLGSVRDGKAKFARNVELLRHQVAETPTPFTHFNLASEYAGAGMAQAAIPEYERAWALLEREHSRASAEYAPSLVVGLAKVLRAVNNPQAAIDRAAEGMAHWPDFTDLVLEQATAHHQLGQLDEAQALFERCLALGDAPARYGPLLGCGTYLPRLGLAGVALDRGDAAGARELLDWCLEHHPEVLRVAGPYAAALLATGTGADAVVAELERRLNRITPPVRAAIARALQRAGATAGAAAQYELALDGDPEDHATRVALAELQLRRGAYGEAARHAALVAGDESYAGLASRLELCAHIAAGDVVAAHRTLAGTLTAGLSRAEQAVFSVWLAHAEGVGAAEHVTVAGLPLLATLLELLLGAGDERAFAQLASVLENSQIPTREGQEVLADVQLRCGRPAAAAQVWMAICQEAPDVRALLGLARVAAAHRMPADAATFVAGALELDPNDADARALAARLPVPAGAA